MSHRNAVKKRSLRHHGRRTSVSLEDDFWLSFQSIARERQMPDAALLEQIAPERQPNLSSVVRVFVLDHFRAKWSAQSASTH